ncbi:MAG: tRNA 2-thiouridine(34) synthase MnmA [Ruminococcaceae bacterium]|nr:tRNA 2-thiouridine(34) synthase MnmA [Oscillospiraceae bacterium]
MKKKVLVAMSGGVDSAVAALLLKNEGHTLGGITMKVWDNDKIITDTDDGTLDQNCADAKEIADNLSIPHHVLSLGDSFRQKVVDKFISDYINGATPNPCVECNRHIKFGKLFDAARSLGYDALATGHYARIEQENGKYLLKKAKDENKDQSYFLWSIKKELLPFLYFPLGDYSKPEIREIAEENGFSNAHRSDSQDICFITDGDYASFIKSNCNYDFPCGRFIDTDGNIIGEHSGIINYTIGQRKGLGVAFGVPMFVGEKNVTSNTVMLCTDEQLYKDTLTATDINILTDESFDTPVRLQAKIRYRHTPAMATVTKLDGNRLSVKFDLPQRAIASGQSVVFYDGDTVVGGGIIE